MAGGTAGYFSAMKTNKVNKTIHLVTQGSKLAKAMSAKQENKIDVYPDVLCDFGILPKEICAICNYNKSNVNCNGCFNEDILLLIHNNIDGNSEFMQDINKYNSNINNYFVYFEMAFKSEIPVSACVKLMTAPEWEKVERLVFAKNMGDFIFYELPMPLSVAKTECVKEMQGKEVLFSLILANK